MAPARTSGLAGTSPQHTDGGSAAGADGTAPASADGGSAGSGGSAPARRRVLGIGIDPLTLTQATGRCVHAVDHGEYLPIGMVNAAKVVAMRKNPRLREAVANCGLVLADGQSVVWASQLLGEPLPERVAGIDLFQAMLAEAAHRGYRVYFLGGSAVVLERMLAVTAAAYPGLAVAGARHGYFDAAQEARIAAEIRRCRPDLLFLGMSSPKKELFAARWGPQAGACVVHGVGGSFDVLAGQARRAPLWYQRHGLEWLYRARQEPVRLGRRYLTTNTAFLALVTAELLRRGGRAGSHGGTAEPGPPAAPSSAQGGQP